MLLVTANKLKCILLCVALLCLSACGLKQEPLSDEVGLLSGIPGKATNVSVKPGDAAVCRSKWSDVPLPLQIEEHLHDRLKALLVNDERGCVFSFSMQAALHDCKTFYLNELEREGWSQNQVFDLTHEVLMSYEKPSKMVHVRITSNGSLSDVRVYVGSKHRKEKGHETVPLIIAH